MQFRACLHFGTWVLAFLAGPLLADEAPRVADEPAGRDVRVVAVVSGEGVRTVSPRRYGRVFDEPLPEGALLVMCDELQVATRAGAVRCSGNVLVKADTFQARAGELLLAGDRVQLRGGAELWQMDEGDAAPKTRLCAQRILFDRASNRLKVEDSRMIDRGE